MTGKFQEKISIPSFNKLKFKQRNECKKYDVDRLFIYSKIKKGFVLSSFTSISKFVCVLFIEVKSMTKKPKTSV